MLLTATTLKNCFRFVLRVSIMKLGHSPSTLRQTQVLVIPGNPMLTEDWRVFDALVNAINQARRNARDYVTNVALEKLDERMYGEGDNDWR